MIPDKCSTCRCSQEKSHLLVTRVTCASFSATTWTDTRGCTAERSRISVIAAIRLVVSVQLICFTCTFWFLHISRDLTALNKPICLSSVSSIALLTLTKTHVFLCPAPELLTDRQAAETPTAMYSWDEQRGKPVLTGRICSSSFLEPPTAFQQPSDCLILRFPQRRYRQQQYSSTVT